MKVALEHLRADVLGLSPLARAVLADRPRPRAAPGLCVPSSIAELPRPEDRFDADERAELSDLLVARLAAYEPHVAVLDAARALRRPGACLVLAGQQPGLLGAPLYNAWKALHAIRLARAASAAWGVPVVAGFWNHADDHDVAEVHHAWVQNPHLDLQRVTLANLDSGRAPLGEIVLDDERHRLGAVRELLRQLVAGEPHAEEALARFVPRSGETFATAFTRLLLELFGAHGLLVIEPAWIRTALGRALARLVVLDPGRALARGAAALERAGHAPGIDPSAAALVYHHEEGHRRALRAVEQGFRYDGEPGSRTGAELAAEIVQSPLEWSPGALLRPIAQDLALPVAAYVGGWGELAYHAELPPLREAAGAPATPFVPRLSATVLEPAVAESLATLGTTAADVLAARAVPEEEGESEPSPVAAGLAEVGARAREGLAALEDALAALDPGLVNQLRRATREIAGVLDKLAGKVERVHANSQGRGRRHGRRVASALVPRGEPQERVRGLLELAARHGTDWLGTLLEELEPFPTEHLVVRLEPGEGAGAAERPR